MDIIIEKASPSDAKDVLDYLKQIGSESDNLTFGAEGLPFSVEAEASYIENIANSQSDIMLLAKVDGKIVGSASINRMPRRMSHRGDFAVNVLKEFWNKGIGTLLTNQVIEFAKENSFEYIDLQVRSDNHSAIHLYKKFGFEKIGTHPSFTKIDGTDISADYMCLKI